MGKGKSSCPNLPRNGSIDTEIIPPSILETAGLGGLVPRIGVIHTRDTREFPPGFDRVTPMQDETAQKAGLIMRAQGIGQRSTKRGR